MSSTEPPSYPSEPSTSSGTSVLEREELREQEPGDNDRYAHYVKKDKITSSAVSGQPVVALCGKVWTPGRDPKKYPVCPTCKEIYESITGGSGSGKGRFGGFGRGGRGGDAGGSGA